MPACTGPGALIALVALASFIACSKPLPVARTGVVSPSQLAPERRATDTLDDDDDPLRPFDPEGMKRHLARRFSGVEGIDYLRVLISPEQRSGVCWTEVSDLQGTTIAAQYAVGGKRYEASGLEGLIADGWGTLYRSPLGVGFEHRVAFDSIDLAVTSRVTCRCAPLDGIAESPPVEVVLRLSWQRGSLPGVSAAVVSPEGRRGLPAELVYGRLLTYEFEAAAPLPAGHSGRCGTRMSLVLLADPPIL